MVRHPPDRFGSHRRGRGKPRRGVVVIDELRILLRGLRLGKGFALYLVGLASRSNGHALVRTLRETEGLCVGVVDAWELWTKGAEILGERERALACGPGQRAVLVIDGIDEFRTHEPAFFRLLNQRRNVMVRATKAAVVLPAEASTIQTLRRQAPDTWSLRAADLFFEAPPVAEPTERGEKPDRDEKSFGHAATKQSRFVRRLADGTSALFGREDALARLDRSWEDPEVKVLTLVAWGGVGKTALITAWRQSLLDRANAEVVELDVLFEWSFYSQGTGVSGAASADVFIYEALVFFGEKELADSAVSQEDKGAKLAEVVGRQRALLILDGIEPLQRADGALREPGLVRLLDGLARRSRGLCLVTTRVWLPELDSYATRSAPRWDLAQLDEVAGAELVKSLLEDGEALQPVSSEQEERKAISRAVRGHALTLRLLGRYIRLALGDVRRWTEIDLQRADDAVQGGHLFRVIDAYTDWLAAAGEDGARELAVLRLMGFFDRGADPGCMAALRADPAIPGVTEAIVGLDEQTWALVISRVETHGLLRRSAYVPVEVAGYDKQAAGVALLHGTSKAQPKVWSVTVMPGEVLEAHPLVREYFALALKRENPEGWREGHRRLFEYLRDSVPYWPEGIDGLRPLYQAVVHGCAADRIQEALEDVYRARVLREGQEYSVRQLGAISADLAALACFFEFAWDRPSTMLGEVQRSWVLGQAAFRLRALGRLAEALGPLRASFELDVEREDWTHSAVAASNLSQLELTLGQMRPALANAEQAVAFADRSTNDRQRALRRAFFGDARHLAGDREGSRECFEEAESIVAHIWPSYGRLDSFPGHLYGELLLDPAERAAWCGTLEDADTLIALCACVYTRATQTLADAGRAGWLLDIGLDHLTLGRAALYAACLRSPNLNGFALAPELNLDAARAHLDDALACLRKAGTQEYVIRGLLTRAWLHHLDHQPAEAQAHLDQADRIAVRGPMPLYLADVCLHRARLFHNRDALAKARMFIERYQYGRRLPELEDAERGSATWLDISPPRLKLKPTPKSVSSPRRPDVAIIIALPEEFGTLAADYADAWVAHSNPTYPGTDFFFEGPGGYLCVVALMRRMGSTYAAQVAPRLLAHRPATIVNIGIAGCLKSGDLRIGDVIVPRQVDVYAETGNVRDAHWERCGSSYHPSTKLLADVLGLAHYARAPFQAWLEAGREQLQALRKGPEQPRLDALVAAKLLGEAPRISTAHLASGSFVVASKHFAEFISKSNADIDAGEMEGGGMMAATEYWRERVDTLVVRGISDHVDADKSTVDEIGGGALRKLAMDNAWRLVLLLMEVNRLPRARS